MMMTAARCWRWPVAGIDGMLVALADTPANRAMFGCTGTRNQEGPGSAPFPQLLAVVITARAGRTRLGAITGKARAGEQTLALPAGAESPARLPAYRGHQEDRHRVPQVTRFQPVPGST